MAESPDQFAGVLRELRKRARMTQEGLADAAGISLRAISDLERGVATIPQKETVRLLADALRLIGPVRDQFEVAARGRAAPGGAAAAATLPRDVVSFTGRQRELGELVDAAAGAHGVVGIHAIDGMAGVGKTAFAVHAAHRLADRFPDGQIFLPLHGHTPGQQPVDPADALASLLLTAGVAPAQIPPGLQARMALWRDRLAGRQLLLILDDAAGSEQVVPLLPGTGESLVLVTSRRHLSALEDAVAISLDMLPAREAAALLVRLAGRRGLNAGDPGVAEITRLCGYLPLAIGLVARQLRHHPAWSAAGRAAELAAAVDRLELIATENVSVAAAFDLSYADLGPDLQRLFRRLGLHPGSEVDGYAAAAVNGTGLAVARRGLEALYDQCLLSEPAAGRYRMHDLIREHARALACRDDPDSDRELATARLLDYYQYAGARADALIARQGRPGPAATNGPVPAAVPALADSEQALGWARAERASLLACLDHVTAAGQHARVIALTAAIAGLLWRDGPWPEAIARHEAAIEAARQLGDRLGQANALSDRGAVQRVTSDYPATVQALEQALDLYRELGDRAGQANALLYLGAVRRMTADYPAAVRALAQALGIYRDLGNRDGQASTLYFLGITRKLTSDCPAAVQDLEQALDLYRDLDDQAGQADALSDLGDVRRLSGEYLAASQSLEQALDLYRDLGDRVGEADARDLGVRRGQANAFLFLGIVRRVTGDHLAAAQNLEQAIGMYRDLGDRSAVVTTLNEVGTLHLVNGNHAQADETHRQALDLAREVGVPWDEGHALAGLGRCALAAGDAAQAAARLRQALEIFERIGVSEAPGLRAELGALTGPSPAW